MTLNLNASQTLNFYGVLEVANVVIHVDSAFRRSEQNSPAVGRPFDELELDFEFLTPEARTFNRADNNCAVLVDNADFLSIRRPPHVCDHTFVAVVDHLFEPVLLVHHPDNNESLLVRRGQFLVVIVPLGHDDIALVAA